MFANIFHCYKEVIFLFELEKVLNYISPTNLVCLMNLYWVTLGFLFVHFLFVDC